MKSKLPEKPYEYQLFINGKYTEAVSGKRFERYSPGHDVLVGRYSEAGTEDVELAVDAAQKSLKESWSSRSGAERAEIILKTAKLIRENLEELALIETLESGKPISQAIDEMNGSAGNWEYAATLARHTRGETYNS